MRTYLFSVAMCLAPMIGYCQNSQTTLIIDSLISAANYAEAKSLIETIGEINDSPLLLNKSAEVSILLGNLNEAESILNSVKSEDKLIQAITQTNLGFLYLNKARNDLAMENLHQALIKFGEAGKQNSQEAAKCLSHLSSLYLSTGKLNQAEENGLMALQIRQALEGSTNETMAASYNDLGLVYSQTDPDKALEYYEMALSVYEKLHGNEHPKIGIANTNIGLMYLQLKLYGDAVNNFESALALWQKVYPSGHPSQALVLQNLGRTYMQMGDPKVAQAYFEKALSIYRSSYGSKHPDIAFVLNQLGNLKLNNNDYKEALENFQEAIIANTQTFNNKTITTNPSASDFYNGKVLLYSLRSKAKALEAQHFGKTLKFDDLKQALFCLFISDSLIDNIRHHSTDENDKLELGSSASEVYEDGVRIAYAMSEMSIDYNHYREVAFYFAEKSKSAVLQESIADASAKSFAGIPDKLVEEEKTLKSTIAFLVQKLSQKPSLDEEKYLRESLFNLNQEYNIFIKKLEVDYPNYFDLKFNQASPTITGLQKLLDNKTAIISYFIAENDKRLYHFIITKKRFKTRNLTLPADFDKYSKGLNNGMVYSESSSYQKSASALSKVLISRFPASITNLVIIPSGRLGTLPFEALFYKKNKSQEFKSMPLVVKRFAVSYEFSAGLLNQKSRVKSKETNPSIFLCAPIQFPEKENMAALPGTESEVNAIANLFPSNSVSVVKFKEANEDIIKSGVLSKFDYLHFATHGVVDEMEPELSKVYLQSGQGEDGNLFAGEIYNLNLNAELAVLSACQTGLGKLSKGEGVIGLSRALVYAGARNIIVSFWSVADESTSQLMANFYSSLIQNRNLNFRETLQKAKVNMIEEGKYSLPYYWAPFILIGF